MTDAGGAASQQRRYAEAAEEFGAALERLARAYERDPEKRRDLLQEIHVALWRSFARFDGRCSMRTWVYRVAHNTATSKVLRPRASTQRLVPLDGSLQAPARKSDEDLDRRRALDQLHGLIRELRPLDRQVMLLYLEELDAAAISEITGLSSANVATRVHRIKQQLVRRFHSGGRNGEQRRL